MLFVSLLRWWYGVGWQGQVAAVRQRLARDADFFSFDQNVRELFQPFKQIDADTPRRGSLDVMLRAGFDKLFSRVFGAVIRSSLIFSGLIAMVLETAVGLLRLVVWPLTPLLAGLCIVLVFSGYTPWR